MSNKRNVRVRSWQVTLILTLFFIAVAGAAGIGWWYARESPPHHGPIVVIAVDDLPADAVTGVAAPAAGEPASAPDESPAGALASLAAEAVIFERAYTHSPELLPSYASLLSGQLPLDHGIRDDAGFTLDERTRTLADLLRNRGFETGAVVSSFLLREETGVGRGFSFYRAPEADASLDPSAPANAGVTGAAITTGDGTVPADATGAHGAPLAGDLVEAAAEWARSQTDQRYFLMLQVSGDDAERAVSTMTALLREKRLYDGSTIIVTGDRGRTDGWLDEGTLRVPLLVRQPGAEGAGRLVSTPVQHIDLLPTILDLVRAPIPGGVNGRSLKPLLTDSDGRIESQPIYAESLAAAYRFGGFPVFALTVNDLRYIRGTEEAVLRIMGAAATAEPAADVAGELPPLRATLDRLLAARTAPRATRIRERDREALARAGLLHGPLQFEPQSALSAEQQQALRSAHGDAARLAGRRQFGAALRALQQIARTHRHLAPVHYQIALLSRELGRSQEAIAALETAATLRPDSPELLSALAVALASSKPADALRHLERARELAAPLGAAELALAHEAAARVALAAGDEAAALRHAEAAQAAAPVRPVRAYVDGLLLAMRGDDVAAAAVLQEGAAVMRQHDVDLEGLHLSLAEVLLRLERYPDAEAEFQAELESYPRSVAARIGLASAQHAAGKTAEAVATVDALIAIMPAPDAYAAAIRLLTAFGEPSRAAALRSDARERFPLETAQARTARASRR